MQDLQRKAFWCGVLARLRNEIDTFMCQAPLALFGFKACRRIGFCRVSGFECDLWQTDISLAVEAVELSSRPLSFQKLWCAHV